MTYQVRTLRRAKRDLSAAAAWYLDRSADTEIAQTWLSGAERTIDSLAIDPHRGGIARESDAFGTTIREILYGSGRQKTHRILFRILEVENLVEVIAVLHFAQRDWTPEDV